MAVPALKEWAVVVRALLAGEQIIDLRKGGLREARRSFSLESKRFWLYPTTEHERPELVKPAYRRWIEGPPDDGRLVVRGWAEVIGIAEVSDPETLAMLESKVVWTAEYAAQRLRWKRHEPLVVLALRTFRLDEPLELEMRDEYVGCASWVDLRDSPDDPAARAAEPVLTDESFAARLDLVSKELPGGFNAP